MEGSERGALWDDNTLTEFREEEEEGDRQRGGAVGREMSSTVQLSLAQVQIHPPFLPSAAPGAVREGGWTYGGG